MFKWMEIHVRRIYWAVAILVSVLVSPASSQYLAVVQACNQDAVKFCDADRTEASRLAQCVQAHFQEFAEPCKAALVKIFPVRKACRVDVQEQCPDAKRSEGRILLCVKKHFAAMSDPCKNAIGQAVAHKVQR
jgi:Cysteine rich repeat